MAGPSFPSIDIGELERYRVPASASAKRLADISPRDRTGVPSLSHKPMRKPPPTSARSTGCKKFSMRKQSTQY
jgi:hypothetical protein